jgi:hypothetical protein
METKTVISKEIELEDEFDMLTSMKEEVEKEDSDEEYIPTVEVMKDSKRKLKNISTPTLHSDFVITQRFEFEWEQLINFKPSTK